MSIQIDCPSCFRTYNLAAKYGGKTVRCKSCGEEIEIPDSGTSFEDEGWARPSTDRPRASRKKKSSKEDSRSLLTKGAAFVGIVLLVLAMKTGARLIGHLGAQGVAKGIGAIQQQPGDPQQAPNQPQAAQAARLVTPPAGLPKIDPGVPDDPHALYQLTVAHFHLPELNESNFQIFKRNDVTVYTLTSPLSIGHGKYQGQLASLKVLIPAGEHAPGSLPCVLVPPAGTPLIFGTPVDHDPHFPEMLPYVRAGCVAITFSLDGWVITKPPKENEILNGYRNFVSSYAGLLNAEHAFRFASEKIEEVNPEQILIAGHSSAGTLALLYAAHQPKLAGCLAYAPNSDVEQHVSAMFPDLKAREQIPGLMDFARRSSPKTHVDQIQCPVFFFQAQNDQVIPVDSNRQFVETLQQHNRTVEFDEITGEDHYQTMIDSGIPAGIQWMRHRSLLSAVPAETLARREPTPVPPATGGPAQMVPKPQAPKEAPATAMKSPSKDVPASSPLQSNREKTPLHSLPVENSSTLEPGMRVLAFQGLNWKGAEVLEAPSGDNVKIHYYSLPAAFDKSVAVSELRIPVPAKEIDRKQIVTLSYELVRTADGQPFNEEKMEEMLCSLEGYLQGTLELNLKNKKVSFKAIKGSSAPDHARHALLRAKCFTGREFNPK